MTAHDSLTDWQQTSLQNAYNLSDGHARDGVGEVISSLDVYQMISAPYGTWHQCDIERRFISTFLEAAGESGLLQGDKLFTKVFYSASVAFLSTCLALKNLGYTQLGALTPSFDNIPQLAKSAGLAVLPVREASIITDVSASQGLDALVLTIPNNPTGWIPDTSTLEELLTACRDRRILVVIDLTFRFQQEQSLEIYAALKSLDGLSWVTIEDTGKTWDLNDLKASFVIASYTDIADALRVSANEILLNVSPAILQILTNVIGHPQATQELKRRRLLARRNRLLLHSCMERTRGGSVVRSSGFVAWVQLDESVDAEAFAAKCEGLGVSILPGGPFEWDTSGRSRYVRVALLREPDYFASALQILEEALRQELKD